MNGCFFAQFMILHNMQINLTKLRFKVSYCNYFKYVIFLTILADPHNLLKSKAINK